jgi:hypothetical protein
VAFEASPERVLELAAPVPVMASGSVPSRRPRLMRWSMAGSIMVRASASMPYSRRRDFLAGIERDSRARSFLAMSN